MAKTLLLLSLRTALWFSPGCLAPCLSRDSYTNPFQKSPLWWEIQTLRKSQKIKAKRGGDIGKHISMQLISVQII